MPRFLYALSGQGRGHRSRALAMAETLRARGHTVGFATSGESARALRAAGEAVIGTPPLVQALDGNRVALAPTVRANAATLAQALRHVNALADALAVWAPDVVVTDFEAFVPRAAARLGLPVVALNHQQILTETRLDVPTDHRWAARLVQLPIRAIAPTRPAHVVVSSFYGAPVRRPDRVTLVGPILRRAVREAVPTPGRHLVVYANDPTLAPALVAALAATGVEAHLYGLPPQAGAPGCLVFCPMDDDAFLADLAACQGVVCTAGHTLLSEALALGKPVLALPNHGLFEQTLNALMLERVGGGMAVYDRPVAAADVAAFLARVPRFRAAEALPPGHDDAADVLEASLARAARGAPASPSASPAAVSPRLARAQAIVS